MAAEPECGRYLVASRDIQPGELVLRSVRSCNSYSSSCSPPQDSAACWGPNHSPAPASPVCLECLVDTETLCPACHWPLCPHCQHRAEECRLLARLDTDTPWDQLLPLVELLRWYSV